MNREALFVLVELAFLRIGLVGNEVASVPHGLVDGQSPPGDAVSVRGAERRSEPTRTYAGLVGDGRCGSEFTRVDAPEQPI